MKPSQSKTEDRLSALRLAGFSLPALATAPVGVALTGYLPSFYAEQMGLGLAAAGTAFTIGRLWGAFADPLVGFLSDHTQTRYGRRKPWILAGGALFVIAVLALFFPVGPVGPLYLGFWLLMVCLGWSMTAIPLAAWGGELSTQYHERSRIQTYLLTAASVGLFCVLVVPVIYDHTGVTALAAKIKAMGLFMAVMGLTSVGLIALFFRETRRAAPAPVTQTARRSPWRVLLTDPLILRVMASDLFVSLGQGMRGATLIFFFTAYMGLPQWASMIYLMQFTVGILAAPIWLRVSYRFGKSRTLIIAELTQVAINLLLLAVVPGRLWLLIALTGAQGLTQGSGNLMLRAITADVADVHRSKTGQERMGLFFSVFNLTANAGFALAVGIAFTLLGWLGFKPGTANDANALGALHIVFALAPALGHFLSAAVMWRYPLDADRLAQITARRDR